VTRKHEEPESRVRWEGDTQRIARTWPDDVRADIGGDIERLEHYDTPLDYEPIKGVKALQGVNELRDEHHNVLYRVMYFLHLGWIYILHCFNKTTEKTSKRDLRLTEQRLKNVKGRKDEPYKSVEEGEERSA
jgi:phage-related protein